MRNGFGKMIPLGHGLRELVIQAPKTAVQLFAFRRDLVLLGFEGFEMGPQVTDMRLEAVILAGHPAQLAAEEAELIVKSFAPGIDPVALHLGVPQPRLGRCQVRAQAFVLIEKPLKLALRLFQVTRDGNHGKLIIRDLVKQLAVGILAALDSDVFAPQQIVLHVNADRREADPACRHHPHQNDADLQSGTEREIANP